MHIQIMLTKDLKSSLAHIVRDGETISMPKNTRLQFLPIAAQSAREREKHVERTYFLLRLTERFMEYTVYNLPLYPLTPSHPVHILHIRILFIPYECYLKCLLANHSKF